MKVVTIDVRFKYLSNFWKTLEIDLIFYGTTLLMT